MLHTCQSRIPPVVTARAVQYGRCIAEWRAIQTRNRDTSSCWRILSNCSQKWSECRNRTKRLHRSTRRVTFSALNRLEQIWAPRWLTPLNSGQTRQFRLKSNLTVKTLYFHGQSPDDTARFQQSIHENDRVSTMTVYASKLRKYQSTESTWQRPRTSRESRRPKKKLSLSTCRVHQDSYVAEHDANTSPVFWRFTCVSSSGTANFKFFTICQHMKFEKFRNSIVQILTSRNNQCSSDCNWQKSATTEISVLLYIYRPVRCTITLTINTSETVFIRVGLIYENHSSYVLGKNAD